MTRSNVKLENGIELCWDSDKKTLDAILSDAKTMQEMRDIDRNAIDNLGIPSLLLMENAARFVAAEVNSYCEVKGHKDKGKTRVTIVCGAGNNGGDGVACAYMLIEMGYDVRVYLCGKREKMTDDELSMEVRLRNVGGELIEGSLGNTEVMNRLREDIAASECCVDALFGVGISRNIAAPYDLMIEAINEAAYIISCDIPSGLNGDSGMVMGCAVKADMTVTFSYVKKGMLADGVSNNCNRLLVVPIGIPE